MLKILRYSVCSLIFVLVLFILPKSIFAEVDHSMHEGFGGGSSSISTSSTHNTGNHIHSTPHLPLNNLNSPSIFKYKARINTADKKPGVYEAILPLEVMTKFHSGDLKIICSDGEEIPFLMLDGERVTPWHSISATLDRYPQKDGSLITILDVGNEGMMHHGVYLQLPVDAHTGQIVSIYGSDKPLPVDSPMWQENKLRDNARIFAYIDSGSSQQVKSNYVDYMQTRARYLKVVTTPIDSFGNNTGLRGLINVEPYNILGALIQTVPSRYINRELRIIEIPSKKVDTKVDRKNGYTIMNIDLGLDNIYTHEFSLKLSSQYGESIPQFIRRYELEKSNDMRHWNTASEGDIYNFKNEVIDAKDFTIRYSETRDRYFRLKIYDGLNGFSGDKDGKPIKIGFDDNLLFKSFARSLIFEVENGMDYDLYFGNGMLSKTFYDKQLLRKYATSSALGLLEIDSIEKNPLYERSELFQDEWQVREKVYRGILLLLFLAGLVVVGVWTRGAVKQK